MSKLLARVFGVRRSRLGQTTAEYAIIAALVAISSIAIILIFGNQIRAIFFASSEQLAGNSSATTTDQTTGGAAEVPGSLDKF